MNEDFGEQLCLGVWKKRENCYDVGHYDLVFKKRGYEEEHGLLFQPDECTWKDTLVCPGVIDQAIQSYDDDVRRMLEIAEHTKREMIRLGYAEESDDGEYEDVEEDSPPPPISLPPAKTPRKVIQKAVRANTETIAAGEDVPSSSRSPRESVSVEVNALFNYGSKATSKSATISKSTTKLKKVKPSKTKKHREAAAAKKVALQHNNDTEDEEEMMMSPPVVAKLVNYHEKVISTSTPAVAPHSSKPTASRKTTARRILEEEQADDEPDTELPVEDDEDQAEYKKDEFLLGEMKRTTCVVDLSKDNLLLEGAGDHGQNSDDLDMMNDSLDNVDQEDGGAEEEDEEDTPSESRRSSRRSSRRLSGYAYSKKMTRERARSYRKSAVAKTMNQIQEDNDEEEQHEEEKTREVEEPGCSGVKTTASSQAASSCVSGKTREGLRKKPKRKPPVAGGTRKFNQKKTSTKSSFGSSTERFTTPTKGTSAVASTPSSSRKRACMTPVSTKKHRGTLSYLNRSTGASRLRRAGDKTSATPIKTPVKYNPQAATIVKSFVQRNTPEKSLTKEAQIEAKKKLLEQKEFEERERKIRIEEEKRMQIAETKRKREERARKANENRELNDQRRAEELKLKNEREQEKQARIESKRKEDMEKKKLHEAKMTDKADKKRKHDNEKTDVKRQKMEEDAANEKKALAKAEKAKQREQERLRKIELKKEQAEKIRKEKELRFLARNKAKEEREAIKKEAEEKRRVEELRRKAEQEEREMELRREELRKKREEELRKKREEELRKKREEELRKKREEEDRKKREEELYKRKREEEIRKRREDERKRLEEQRKQLERERERQRMEEEANGDESMNVQDETQTESELDESMPPVEEFKTPTALRKPSSTSTPLMNETYNLSEQDTSSVTQYNMTPAGPDKLRLPSTKDDYNIHDLDSGDSTDEEDAPRKKVPSWASGFEFKRAMRRQCVTNPTSISARFPEARGRSKNVDLNILFKKNRPRYNKRTSSACWSPKGPGHVSFHLPSD